MTRQPCSWDCGDWCVGSWDTRNVRGFLQWVHDARLIGFGAASPLVGFELGNELVTHLDPAANLADIVSLTAMLREIWADGAPPPLLAPSTDSCSDPSAALILGGPEAGFSFHAYPGRDGTGEDALSSILLNTTWLRAGLFSGSDAAQCLSEWGSGPRARGTGLWLTEASASYSTDVPPPAQNSFLHGFFTLAELGAYARTGVSLVARWAFAEHSPFALLARNASRGGAWDAAADYFVINGYLRTVGAGVLAVTGDEGSDAVLVFAHCAAAGGVGGNGSVTVFAINVSPNAQALRIAGAAATTPRLEYVLTAPGGDLSAFTPVLNGAAATPLRLAEDGSMPTLAGAYVGGGGDELLELPPRSQAFFVLLGARAPACAQ